MFQEGVRGYHLVYGTWEIFQDKHMLLVQNISSRTSVHDIFMVFSRHGTLKVADILLPSDKESRTLAFVRYQHADDAQKAMALLQGTKVHGHRLVVQNAKIGRVMAPEPCIRERSPRLLSTGSAQRLLPLPEGQNNPTADHLQRPYARTRRRRAKVHDQALTCHQYYDSTRRNRHYIKSKIQSDLPSHKSASTSRMEVCSSSLSPPPGFSSVELHDQTCRSPCVEI